ncbi:CHASE domain-containing protein [Massilia glaciei]|uniref:Sensory/regulatory protein RpfC n=1 Tax=Massilia glaciei TaxID=1524097 RepID=A0A2U2HE52_9BURK|nr:CHASE domain-containing protein [Massilia glaciei]PWF41602.1 hybrid sensor and regulator [Massilia glaciei]
MEQVISNISSAAKGASRSRLLLWGAGVALSLVVGALAHMAAARTVEADARERLGGVARSAQYSLTARVKSYTDVIRGVVALFHTSDAPVTRLQFHRYVDGLDIDVNFPAIEVLTYAAHVPEAELAGFVAQARADRSVDPAGQPGFALRPPGHRPAYTILTFIEPLEVLRDALGTDIGADPVAARALAHARDNGRPHAAGAPLQNPLPHTHVDLNMQLPIYHGGSVPRGLAARRSTYAGSVGVVISMPALVQGAIDEMALRQVRLAVYEDGAGGGGNAPLAIGAADRLLFSDGAGAPPAVAGRAAYLETVLPVDFNGSRWKARFRVKKSELYTTFDRAFPVASLVAGMAGTMLLYAFFFTLYWSRRGAMAQRALLDSVLDSLDAHVYMKDRERRYTYINAKSAAGMGLRADQVIGKFDREVLPDDLADAYWREDLRIFDSGQRSAAQSEFALPGCAPRQLWNVKVPVMQDGEVAAVIGLSTDVTELHALRARADAANLAKSNFLSNMSHEIRTPMNSIIGMSHLALKSATNPKQRDYLEKISHSSQHLLGIINDILDFSKIEAGKLELEVLDFDPRTLMQNIANQLGEAAAARRLTLEFQMADDLAHQFRGDPLRLEQVLLNFVSNAIKFSEDGAIVIGARPLTEAGGETMVRFDVRDCGIGMSAAEVGELFKSFHQADPSTTRKYGGTGLGLVISKQLAELMGGCVGVESAPGRGSTFWFTARLGKCVNFLPAGPDEVPQGVLEEIAGAYILLVEDNIFSQQVGQELLEELHATVVVANNGKEAIDMMLKERFDCVLMDVQMPVMDGFEATAAIRADPRLRDSLVIAMTANAGMADRARCLAAGMDEFVSKPIAPQVLFEVIARWLRKRPARNGRRRAVGAGDEAPTKTGAAPLVSSDAGLLDMEALAATFGRDPDKMRKYAFMFLDSARDGLAEISEAHARGDLVRLAELGHRTKSSARAVGAASFGQVSFELEQLRAGGTLEQAQAIIDQMYPLLERLRAHIALELTVPAAG